MTNLGLARNQIEVEPLRSVHIRHHALCAHHGTEIFALRKSREQCLESLLGEGRNILETDTVEDFVGVVTVVVIMAAAAMSVLVVVVMLVLVVMMVLMRFLVVVAAAVLIIIKMTR